MKNFIIWAFFLTTFLGADNLELNYTSQSKNFLETKLAEIDDREADDELQEDYETSLERSFYLFLAKGGRIFRLDEWSPPFKFAKGDVVFPSCAGANNRSQTLWNILQPYNTKITVMPPHATRFGFDPYNGLVNWHRAKHSFTQDEFQLWANVVKSKKFGWDNFESWLSKTEISPIELNILRQYFNQNYYNPRLSSETRKIYITFSKNVHIHLARLSETNSSLENVILLFYPISDLINHPLPEWQTYKRSKEAYVQVAALIRKHLDFSEL